METCCGGIFLWSVIPGCLLHLVPACLDRPVDCSLPSPSCLFFDRLSSLSRHSTRWPLRVKRTSLRTASSYLNRCSLRLSDVVLCPLSSFPHFIQTSFFQDVVWRLYISVSTWPWGSSAIAYLSAHLAEFFRVFPFKSKVSLLTETLRELSCTVLENGAILL